MAQQMILAAHRRQREAKDDEENMGGSPLQRKSVAGGVNVKLRRALKKEIGRLSQLFAPWDADGSGSIDELEFRRAIRMLGLRTDPRDFQEFAKLCKAADGGISLDALIALVEAEDFDFDPEEEAQKSFKEPKPAKKRNLCVRAAGGLGGLVNTVSAQTLLYFSFVILFQLLTDTLRLREEYLLDKFVSDTFFDNHFDATLNQFAHIRRTADVFEWGNQVLWPWAARQLLEHAPHAACACAPSCVWHVHRRCCGRGCSATARACTPCMNAHVHPHVYGTCIAGAVAGAARQLRAELRRDRGGRPLSIGGGGAVAERQQRPRRPRELQGFLQRRRVARWRGHLRLAGGERLHGARGLCTRSDARAARAPRALTHGALLSSR